MQNIRSFWYKSKNVGDTLTPIIVEHFTGKKVEWVDRPEKNKLLAIGSIMKALRRGDIVWGAGVMRETDIFKNTHGCNFLAVRGKLSEKILNIKCGVYGDPALLLPLIYNPKIEKKHKVGIIPHYIEAKDPYFITLQKAGNKMIDVMQDWKSFVDEVVSCESIQSSSLHGIIIAEAYGIPATWLKISNKVLGNGFKFNDYRTGTGRSVLKLDKVGYPFETIKDLETIQNNLIKVLQNHYGNK